LGSIYKADGNVWVGWPGLFVDDPAEQADVTERLKADSMAPVFLTEAEIRDFYEGFSNSTLWPTFHYFPQFATYEDAHWAAYVAANEKFCEAVLALAGPDDTIWVQDYQLLLLPEMLRKVRPQATIGFRFRRSSCCGCCPGATSCCAACLGPTSLGFTRSATCGTS
jgi:trehalose 6-phosphate synthase/phosphatase